MKIYEFKCPSCGADLEEDGTKRIVRCRYCRKTLYVDYETDPVTVSIPDARQAGREFELGRMDARREASAQNAEVVSRILENYPKLMEFEEKKAALEEKLSGVGAEIREASRPDTVLMPLLGFGLVLAAMSCIYHSVLMLLMGIPASLFLLYFALCQQSTVLRKLRKKEKKLSNSLNKVSQNIASLRRSCHSELVPEAYRTPERLEFLEAMLESCRASTIPEAIGLYESEQRFRELAEQNKKLLEIQQLQTKEIVNLKSRLV